jgi:hypothetical protein
MLNQHYIRFTATFNPKTRQEPVETNLRPVTLERLLYKKALEDGEPTRSSTPHPPRQLVGMGVGDLVALADAAHVGAAGLAVGSTIRFLIAQDAHVRGDSQDEVPMEPSMYGRLATAMTTAVSRRHGTPDGDDYGDNEPMWSLELASSWAHLDATCGSHALAESQPLITTSLAMLPMQRPTVARAGCLAEGRFKQRTYCSVP